MDTIHLCGVVGTLIKPEKVVGPTTCLPLLGILLDTVRQGAQLPEDKIAGPGKGTNSLKTKHDPQQNLPNAASFP